MEMIRFLSTKLPLGMIRSSKAATLCRMRRQTLRGDSWGTLCVQCSVMGMLTDESIGAAFGEVREEPYTRHMEADSMITAKSERCIAIER